ncbi:cation transporter [Dehalococcoides sp. THU3]|uniref:cation transporter n=1 Tax=Dehalococcoides TaxID=61434 RepID=UPI001E5E971A|nr:MULTISPECIES: cation transporter [Dehalococcoides]UJP38237.1 cation transporter [Dehalococcoides mccartyi]
MPVSNKLRLGIIFSSIILFAEFIGGLASNSLALLSDAGNVLTDVLALSLSYFALMQAKRPANWKYISNLILINTIKMSLKAENIYYLTAALQLPKMPKPEKYT